jgi:two-component system CAI-1 autoinducer sensor kinase/phosphatase CqsS
MIKSRFTSRFLRHAPARGIPAPVEPILHPSPWRLRLLGLALSGGNPLFYWIWSSWLKQPYENLWLRILMSALGLILLIKPVNRNLSSRRIHVLVSAIMWIELPLFFSWMYLCNAGGSVWLPSLCVIVLVYYHLTDWRIATVGTVSGALVAWVLFHVFNPGSPVMLGREYALDAVLMAFSWGSALLLGVSSANLRREHLAHTLATMGIMAHELRTPLSTAALIGDAIQQEVQRQPDHPRAMKLDKLGQRLHTLVRNMNHQIDTQIANAKLLQLPQYAEQVSAGTLVQEVVASYPYASSRQRECVKLVIHDNFTFCSSPTQFSQVLDNLIKNALHSLTAADSLYHPGALRIEVGRVQKQGRIIVADDGIGIEPALLQQIFKPFFSSNRSTGHGLGLAFCQQVVQSAGGSLHVKSEYAVGALFTIMLPIADC